MIVEAYIPIIYSILGSPNQNVVFFIKSVDWIQGMVVMACILIFTSGSLTTFTSQSILIPTAINTHVW